MTSSKSPMDRLLWIFGCSDGPPLHYNFKEMTKHAVMSALANTTLRMMCLYDGTDMNFVQWLQQHHVTVIQHQISFLKNYLAIGRESKVNAMARGMMLRIDIPIILRRLNYPDDYILYTDTDVIFVKNPVFTIKPTYFSCCNQFVQEPSSIDMNSGVMYMNVKMMEQTYTSFIQHMIKNRFVAPDGDAFDQGQYASFYAGKWDHLPPTYNWKPYWGINNDAIIVHYHGSKASDLEKFFTPSASQVAQIVHLLFQGLNKTLDWKEYLKRYPNLPTAQLNTLEKVLDHWTKHGIHENKLFPGDRIVPILRHYIALYNRYAPPKK
jgi:hypothetical protein